MGCFKVSQEIKQELCKLLKMLSLLENYWKLKGLGRRTGAMKAPRDLCITLIWTNFVTQ